jgi:Subtilase family/PA domain/Fibronectin type-III domain
MSTRRHSGPRRRRAVPAILLLAVAVGATSLIASGIASGEPGGAAARFQATALTPDSTFEGAKSLTGYIARTDPSLVGRTDAALVNVLLKYDYDAAASYTGGVSGLAATSPSVTGEALDENSSALEAYDRYTASLSQKITAAVKDAVPAASVRGSYRTVYGGIAARVPANAIDDLLKVDGVVAVQRDSIRQPLTDATPQFLGATDVWPSLGGSVHAGENVTVGVLDTGIWPEHQSFRDTGLPAPTVAHQCQFGDGTDVAHLGPTFICNNKLVGAYAFTATYLAVIGAEPGEYCNNATARCSARDPDGHGMHTSSTAAGDPVASAPIFGIERGPISGMAPGAHVIMYRICLEQGCFGSDAVAAVQQAILDDVDVINYSISGGAQPYTDPVELAFLDAFNAGISVNASAGNSGPGAGTADHGGPWVTTVGASSSNRAHQTTLHLTASNGDTFDLVGSTITPGIGSTPVVLATSFAGVDAACVNPIPAGAAAGKIVVCQRTPNRVLKSFNVRNAGGLGMILYNVGKEFVMTDNHWVPTIHVDGPSGLIAFITGHSGVLGSWPTGAKTAIRGDVMTQFSSRGPLGDFVKPDVTAPGIQILAGMTPTPATPLGGPPGELFQAIGGTSMSSPHSAGASAVVKAVHPDWTPAMIKSALMTSSVQDVLKEDGVTPFDPFDAGAGAIRINRAVSPTLVFDETFADFVASAADPLHRIDLNLASVNAPTMTGTITTTRTALNVSGKDQELKVTTEAPAGATITVGTGNKNLHVNKNGEVTFSITISAPALPTGQYFGRITLDPQKQGANEVTIPVAFFKRQGAVTLTHTCDTNTFLERTGHAHCVASLSNLSPLPAEATLAITKSTGLDFTNITAPPTAITTGDGVSWSGTLSPSVPPQVVSITPTVGPAGGYLPLSALGIAPIAGVGDDTIANFNVPAFRYGGEPYTRVGVVSNGYIVLGGGTSADIVFTPQTFPNPARPNNVIAPFWSDLNPAVAGGIRIATLTDGTSTWLVVDWQGVRNFSNPTTHSFEIWLKLGNTAASEEITLTYGTNGAGDPGSGSNRGAENRDGTSGKNIPTQPANGSEFAVVLAPPQAGGTITIGYDASADKAGTYQSVASMTSNVTPGITQVVQTFVVTRP